MYVYVWTVCPFSVTSVLIYSAAQHCLGTFVHTMKSQRCLLQPYSFCFVSVILTPLFLHIDLRTTFFTNKKIMLSY